MKRIIFMWAIAVPCYATKFLSVEFSPDTIIVGKRMEVAFEVSRNYDNPFNPTEVEIDAVIAEPSGRRLLVPAFWYQEFFRRLEGEEEVLTPAGKAGWRVRFLPSESGRHSIYLQVRDVEGTNQSDLFHFNVQPGESRGFIRVDSHNPRLLSFDDGGFYFPMGHNVAWATNRGTFDYDDWMKPMAEAGENWMRVWMTHFYKGQTLEWNASHWSGWYHGLGRYSLQGAWKLDYIIEQAEKLGIYIQLVTQHHGQFSQTVNPNWDDNPYNIANGGFLRSGDEFFTNEQAKEL
ncbi:MAG: DUF5060 domain-containing protein, partial [candidate division KSB1 bacterium]|nr:DUF5060 domain-containing protein [candidate division KSB1 bacterium]